MKNKIAASMMCANIGNLMSEVNNVVHAGVDILHFDVMDGQFVPNFGFAPWMIKSLKESIGTVIPFEVHLMIEEPENHLKSFLTAGADIVILHLKATRNIIPLLKEIRKAGAKAGVALSPTTGPEVLKYLIPYLDVVTIMTVSPGFAGGEFLPEMVAKVEDTFKIINTFGLPVEIEVDGNINSNTIPILARVGANIFVGGSSGLFRKDIQLEQAVRALRAAADNSVFEKRGIVND